MADTQTTNLNLTKPEPGAAEDTWGISLNADLDTLDAIFSSSGTQVNLNPNQINFANNKKAIFGVNSDLSIYSDGTTSIIQETGPGALNIQGTHLNLTNAAGNASYLAAVEGGAVTLYNSGSPKLATTSTGIDVTGTVTADGLTTNGASEGDTYFTGGTANSRLLNIFTSTTEGAANAGHNFKIASGQGQFIFGNNTTTNLLTVKTGGIDVTGTVNTDSLTVTGDITQTTGDLKYTGGINWDIAHHGASQNMIFRTTPSGGSATQRIRVSHNGDISFYDDTGSTQGFFWDASAEALGISNTAPTSTLTVGTLSSGQTGNVTINNEGGNTAALQVLSRTNRSILKIADNDTTGYISAEGGLLSIGRNSGSNAANININSSNNVGIGTDNPSHKLTVGGTTSSTTARVLTTTGNANLRLSTNNSDFAIIGQGGSNKLTVYDNNASTTRLTLDSGGNLLVGKSSTSYGVEGIALRADNAGVMSTVTDNFCFIANRLNSDGTLMLFAKDTGTVGSISTASGATTYNTSSDARLKDVTGEARGLEVINELNPVSYNWKADGKADEGLIAQEVQEIVPNAVSGSEEEHYQMDYSKLVVHLVKAVKEQQTQIESLKGEIANLKGE